MVTVTLTNTTLCFPHNLFLKTLRDNAAVDTFRATIGFQCVQGLNKEICLEITRLILYSTKITLRNSDHLRGFKKPWTPENEHPYLLANKVCNCKTTDTSARTKRNAVVYWTTDSKSFILSTKNQPKKNSGINYYVLGFNRILLDTIQTIRFESRHSEKKCGPKKFGSLSKT